MRKGFTGRGHRRGHCDTHRHPANVCVLQLLFSYVPPTMEKGTEVLMVCLHDSLLMSIDGQQYHVVHSSELSRAFQRIYLGDNSVQSSVMQLDTQQLNLIVCCSDQKCVRRANGSDHCDWCEAEPGAAGVETRSGKIVARFRARRYAPPSCRAT